MWIVTSQPVKKLYHYRSTSGGSLNGPLHTYLCLKDNRLIVIHHDTVTQDSSQCSCQYKPLQIPSLPYHVLHAVSVRYSRDILLYDGPCIQLAGCVVCCGAYHLHTSLVRSVVWLCPCTQA